MLTLDFGAVLQDWPMLARGLAMTAALTAVSALVGGALGVACAWARTWGPRWLGTVVAVYVELIRNTPFIVQLFFITSCCPLGGLWRPNKTTDTEHEIQ